MTKDDLERHDKKILHMFQVVSSTNFESETDFEIYQFKKTKNWIIYLKIRKMNWKQ